MEKAPPGHLELLYVVAGVLFLASSAWLAST
jgi:hypothetical protein